VLPDTLATRILVENGRAVGVEAMGADGVKSTFRASREVLVTSGAVGSPKLLLLSGIGPAEELREVGVPLVHDLPGVGKNFHDHLDITVIYRCLKPITYDGQDAFMPSLRHGLQFLLFRTGNVASSPCQAAAYVRSDPLIDIPDISLHFLPVGFLDHGRIRLDGHSLTFHNNNMRPRSRGEIRLTSTDPFAEPHIDPNYAADPHDMKVMIACVRWVRRLMRTEAMAPYAGDERYPGKALESDEDIAAYVREHAETDYHPVGSCKMGADTLAVVDDTLKVHGLQGLRVADSSIMPAIISGNTNAPTIMIACKAADFIASEDGRIAAGSPRMDLAHAS
jgi:choline dehydrogenase-like flavoprotein